MTQSPRGSTRIRPMRLVLIGAIASGAVLSSAPHAAAAAAAAGSSCPKGSVGKSVTVKGQALVCTRVGSKTVYRAAPAATTPPTAAPAPPAAPTPTPAPAAAPAAAATLDGTWNVTADSVAGYRVKERFTGGVAKVEAVGRTNKVTGTFVIARQGDGLVARTVAVEVDMTSLKSDQSRRDNALKTLGIETDRFQKSTFVSTGDIVVPKGYDAEAGVEVTLRGQLTIHGTARAIDVPAKVRLVQGTAEIVATVPIKMADYGMTAPAIPGFVTADDDGELEFKIVAKHA